MKKEKPQEKKSLDEIEQDKLIKEYLNEKETADLIKEGFNKEQIACVAKINKEKIRLSHTLDVAMEILTWVVPIK